MSTQTGSISFESTGNFSQVVKQNYATLSQIKGQFAVCSTGASTTEKIATTVPTNADWTLYAGATVTVKFTSANTASVPTLNVNGTGPKQIRDYNANELLKAAREWPAGAAIAFTYDGTYWRVQDSNLMERVHSAETRIDQTATSITSLASMEDSYTKPDGTTATNNLKSYVDQTAEGITTTIENITETVQHSGNLLPHTSVTIADREWLSTNIRGAWTDIPIVLADGYDAYKYDSSWAPGAYWSGYWCKLRANTYYTYSVDVYYTKAVSFNMQSLGHFQVYNANSSLNDKSHEDVAAERVFTPSTVFANTWTRVSVTFLTNSLDQSSFAVYPRFNIAAGDGTLYFKNAQLEYGKIATGWTPSSSDLSTVTNTVNSVKQTADANTMSITGLRTTVSNMGSGVLDLSQMDIWEQGTTSERAGQTYESFKTDNTTRIRIEKILAIKPGDYLVTHSTDYSVGFLTFDSDRLHLRWIGWNASASNTVSFNANEKYIAVLIMKAAGGAIIPSEAISANLRITDTNASQGSVTTLESRSSKIEQTLDGFSSTVGAIVDETVAGTNILTGNALNPYNWTISAPARANYTKTAYGTAGVKVQFNAISGYEWLYSPAITVVSGKKYTLSAEYTVGKDYTIASGKGGYGLSVYKTTPPHSSYDNANANFIARAQFFETATRVAMKATVTFTATTNSIYLGLNGGQINDSQTGLTFTMDKLTLVENISSRVSTAETSINQTADAIGLTASGTATIANPNLTPFYSMPLDDVWNATTNPKGYWRISTSRTTKLDDGWAHIAMNNTSGTGTMYVHIHPAIDTAPVVNGTLLIEIRNFTGTTTAAGNLWYNASGTSGTEIPQMVNNSSTMGLGLGNGSYYHKMKPSGNASPDRWVRAWFGLSAGFSVEFDARLSFYEGEYTGPYKPYSGSQLYASQAELKVANDAISARVEKNGVIASINASVETSGGSAVKISADKVNIEGAAIFTSGRLSSTSLNNAYDSKGSAAAVQSNLDNLKIGGINLFSWPVTGTKWKDEEHALNNYQNKGSFTQFSGSLLFDPSETLGEQYTISFWAKSPNGTTRLQLYNNNGNPKYFHFNSVVLTTNLGNEWQYFTYTVTNTEYDGTNTPSTDNNIIRRIEIYAPDQMGVLVKKIKVEKGNRATDWSPAPEDQEILIEALSDYTNSIRTWYAVCSTAAATAAKVATIDPVTSDFTASILTPGTVVFVKFITTNTAAVADLTLNINSTGAKPIKQVRNGTVQNLPGVGYLAANATYQFTYDGANWLYTGNYDSNSNDNARYVQFYNTIVAGEVLHAASIIGGRTDGKFYQIKENSSFDLSSPLLWLTTDLNEGAADYSHIYTQSYDRNLATYYTSFVNTTANKIVYLVGTVNGNTFNTYGANSNSYLTVTPPAQEDGRFYIPIGRLGNQSNGKNYFNYQVAVPVSLYAFIDGKFRQVTPTEILATQKIYYRSKVSGNVPVPKTWITSKSNIYNDTISVGISGWSTKVTPLSKDKTNNTDANKYLYLYTCEQRKRLDGTVECVPTDNALLDDSTTVIDGGNIITGSIAANTIKADSGTFNTANIPNLSAAKITSGDIATDRIKANAVNAINATVNKIDAKNINVNAINIGDLSGTVGGKNLALDSDQPYNWQKYTPTTYEIAQIKMTEDFIPGETYTVTIWGGPITRSDKSSCWYALYWGGGNFSLANTTLVETGVYRATFTISTTDTSQHTAVGNNILDIYNTPAVGTSGTTYSAPITKIQIEKGNVGTEWEPAQEELPRPNLYKTTTTMAYIVGSGSSASGTITAHDDSYHGRTLTVTTAGGTLRISNIIPKTNIPYTVSFILTASVATTISVDIMDNTVKTITVPKGTSKVIFTSTPTRAVDSTYHFIDMVFNTAGTYKMENIKVEMGTVATTWIAAEQISNYIHADSTGINIYDNRLTNANKYYLRQTAGGTYIYKNSYLKAKYEDTITLYGGSNASGANPKVELSSSAFNMYDSAGKKRVTINTSGLTIYDASATPVDVANFGTSVGTTGTTAFARIGLSNSTRFEISPTTLSAYTGNTKYFEVSASGLQYGSGLGNTAATTTNVNSAKAEAIRIAGTSKTNLIAYNPDPANMLASVYTGQAKTSYPLYAMSNSANTGSQGRQFVQNYTNNTASSKYLMLCPFSPNEFAPGDIIEFKGRGANWDTAITTAKLCLWFYKTNTGTNTVTYTSGNISMSQNAWFDITATITIPSDANLTESKYYLIGFDVGANRRIAITSDSVCYKVPKSTLDAAKTATNYMSFANSTLKIASASPGTQKQRIELTSSSLKMFTGDGTNGTQRFSVDSTNGVIVGRTDQGHVAITDTGMTIYGSSGNDLGSFTATTANNETTYVRIGPTSTTSTSSRVLIKSTGMEIFKGATSVALFGDTATIGINDNQHSHITLDYHSLQLIDKEGNTYFHVSDLRDNQGQATIKDVFYGDGTTKAFNLSLTATNNTYTVTVSNSSGGTVTKTTSKVTFASAPTSGATITITYSCTDSRIKAFTFGTRKTNSSIGVYSFSEGYNSSAQGHYSHAEGFNTIAGNIYTHAEGYCTQANGWCSHAEGCNTIANSYYSHAEGFNTRAYQQSSHAEGNSTIADGQYSHAEGVFTTANGGFSHAEGKNSIANSPCSHAEGHGTLANKDHSHAEGYNTIANGLSGHAEGYNTIAGSDYSHAQGRNTIANGQCSHAEGYNTKTNNSYSHAEGHSTIANNYSHAEGYGTKADGLYSHAEGYNTLANGIYSHASGYYTIAEGYQFVCGKYNSNQSSSLFEVGNGTGANTRKNALTLDTDGNLTISGTIKQNGVAVSLSGTSLYENTSGKFSGAITLSETAANFTFIEIYCKDNDGRYCYTKVWSPNGKTVNVTQTLSYDGNFYIKSKAYAISGTGMDTASTSGKYHTGEINAAGNNFGSTVDNLGVVKVIGYK